MSSSSSRSEGEPLVSLGGESGGRRRTSDSASDSVASRAGAGAPGSRLIHASSALRRHSDSYLPVSRSGSIFLPPPPPPALAPSSDAGAAACEEEEPGRRRSSAPCTPSASMARRVAHAPSVEEKALHHRDVTIIIDPDSAAATPVAASTPPPPCDSSSSSSNSSSGSTNPSAPIAAPSVPPPIPPRVRPTNLRRGSFLLAPDAHSSPAGGVAATPASSVAPTPVPATVATPSTEPESQPAEGRSEQLLRLDADCGPEEQPNRAPLSGAAAAVASVLAGLGFGNSGASSQMPSAGFVRQLQLSTINAHKDAFDAAITAPSAPTLHSGADRSDPDEPSAPAAAAATPAAAAAELPHESENALRMEVVSPELGDSLPEVLDWSGKGLRVAGVEGGWSLYPTIHTLILRDNDLTTLLKQGLDSLPNLHTLDLRRNRLSAFGDTLLALSQCRSLRHVYLHYATRDGATNNPALYTDFVFQSLRGLESCDGVVSKYTIALNPLGQSAFEMVHLLSGGMSENELLRCDLSNRALPSSLFFFLLSALYQLKIAWLKLDGNNGWATRNSYTNDVIFYLGKYLLFLDEEEVTHQRLHLALKAHAESKNKIVKMLWEDVADEALAAAHAYIARLEREAEEEEERLARVEALRAVASGGSPYYDEDDDAAIARPGRDSEDVDAIPLTDTEAAVLVFTTGLALQPGGGDDRALQGAKDKRRSHSGENRTNNHKQIKSSAHVKDEATGFNLHVPGRGFGAGALPGTAPRNSVLPLNAVSTHNSNVGIDTQISNKIEILIHYLQVYGLVLLSSIHIPWPRAFLTFSEWVRIFTLNLDSWFSFLPFQQNLFFWVVSFFPVVLLLLFWRIARLRGNLDRWVEDYVTNWTRTKRRVLAGVGIFVGAGVLASMLFIGAPVYAGAQPDGSNYTAALCFFLFPSLGLLVWWLAIRRFRRGWEEDTSVDKDVFRSEWLSRVNFWQWLCLFLITNTFMPVARVILRQFECRCDGLGELNSGFGGSSGDADTCYSVIDTARRCFPHHTSLTQIVAFICGVLYLIGIPTFYFKLIRSTVLLVLSTSRQYKLLTQEIERLDALPKQQRAPYKEDLKEYKRIQFKLYYNIVNNPLNSVPASSLFAAYQCKYKYTKLMQMFQKVLLVVVSLFLPDRLGSLDRGGQAVWAALVIALYLGALLAIRPYNDPLDDCMDLLAECGNMTSILVAISIVYNAPWLSATSANALLLAANLIIILSFVLAFIISPARTFWRRRKRRQQMRQQELEMQQLEDEEDGKGKSTAAKQLAKE